jgi:1,4-dihydroxy-2-naphthoate octaprenyltransferase
VPRREGAFLAGFWRLADPKISLASLASVTLGALAAAAQGPLSTGWLAATVAAVLAIEIAKNASGEIFDFDSGADLAVRPEDRTPFSGGKRVLVEGLLTRRATAAIAAAGYLIGIAIGLVIAWQRAPGVLWFGLAGVGCAWFYHAPPLKLSYRGLGELAVGLCYGPLICLGTYLVQRQQLAAAPIAPSVALGLAIAAFLWINQIPDYEADRAAGKLNLVARIGRRRASRVFLWLIDLAFLVLILAPALSDAPLAVWLGLLGLVPGAAACRTAWREPDDTSAIIGAQRNTLLAFLVLSVGAGLGLYFG